VIALQNFDRRFIVILIYNYCVWRQFWDSISSRTSSKIFDSWSHALLKKLLAFEFLSAKIYLLDSTTYVQWLSMYLSAASILFTKFYKQSYSCKVDKRSGHTSLKRLKWSVIRCWPHTTMQLSGFQLWALLYIS